MEAIRLSGEVAGISAERLKTESGENASIQGDNGLVRFATKASKTKHEFVVSGEGIHWSGNLTF
jgi:hypothetical protein